MDKVRKDSRSSFVLLLVHDFRIVGSHLRCLFSRLGDILIALAFLAGMTALVRAQLFSLSLVFRQIAVAVAATAVAWYLQHILARRIAFFRTDSVLAAAALNRSNALNYTASVASICGVFIAVALFVPDLSLTASFLLNFGVSFLVVAMLSASVASVSTRLSYQKQERLAEFFASRHRGAGAAIAAAGGVAIILLAAFLLDVEQAAAVAVITSVALSLWYAPVDYQTIEYEAFVGLSPPRSVWTRLRDLVLVAGLVTGGALLSLRWQLAAIVFAAFLLLLLYKCLEILAIRAFGGVKARVAIIIILFGVASISLFLPFSIPLLVPACGAWLVAAGRRRTWQLS